MVYGSIKWISTVFFLHLGGLRATENRNYNATRHKSEEMCVVFDIFFVLSKY